MRSASAAARALLPAALTICSLAIAGCTPAGGSSVNVTGTTLAIYASAPAGQIDAQAQQDVLDAEQLAFDQGQAAVTAFKLRLVRLTKPKISDDARSAIEDKSAVAYVGEMAPGASADAIGITNALDLLQVSPTDTEAALTRATPAVPGSPDRYYEALSAYGHTFGRVVATTDQEASGLVSAMSSMGVRSLYVADDASDYGRALAAAIAGAAGGKLTIRQGAATAAAFSASGADALLLAARSMSLARSLLPAVAGAAPSAKLFAPSAYFSQSLAAALGGHIRNLYVSVPGLLPSALPASGQAFVSAFTARYGHAPDPRAIFGYEAMSAVLAVLREAGANAGDRSTVVRDFFAIRNRASALGTYSIDSAGDPSLGPFVFSRVRHGQLSPFAFVEVP
jgi:ABC-type branched-subunit amino acid transport system substrate-binding protein